ncbi:unnamed protein product, partial [Arabidopsis halleri]
KKRKPLFFSFSSPSHDRDIFLLLFLVSSSFFDLLPLLPSFFFVHFLLSYSSPSRHRFSLAVDPSFLYADLHFFTPSSSSLLNSVAVFTNRCLSNPKELFGLVNHGVDCRFNSQAFLFKISSTILFS